MSVTGMRPLRYPTRWSTSLIALSLQRHHLPTVLKMSFATTSETGSPSRSLPEALADFRNDPRQVFLMDGGTGEELFRRGVPDDRKIWSATAVVNSQHHGTLQQVHGSFLKAGALSITTNSYGVVPGVGFDVPEERAKYIGLAGEIARQAVTDHKTGYVLGSLGPLVESYRADMIKSHADGVQDYLVACQALQPHVDAFLAETMSCIEESSQALEAVGTLTPRLPLLVSYTLDSQANFRDGQDVLAGIRQLLDLTHEHKVELLAILFNCSEPEAISVALAKIVGDQELHGRLKESKILLGAYANRLTVVDPNWTLAESETPQPFRQDLDEARYWNDFVQPWIDQYGIQMVGGCCGITPEHIAYIRAQLDKRI